MKKAQNDRNDTGRATQQDAQEIEMRKWNSERGMSLVEATIILMVLAILTAVIAPTAGDFASEARNIKGKEDVESLAMSIVRLQRDFGKRKIQVNTGSLADVNLLVSGTGTGTGGSVTDTNLTDQPGAKADATGGTSWATSTSATHAAANRVSMDATLVTNTAGFTAVSFTGGGGPQIALGWRGPYSVGPIDLDPWGSRYQANLLSLATVDDATVRPLVLSPGTNGIIETVFLGAGVPGGDDIIYVIAGGAR